MEGAYRGFFDANIQADWVHIDDIAAYEVLYLPLPLMLNQATADRLRAWVEGGGTLIAEGCPGYFGDHGHVGTVQPNLGLDELFGARESYVEFTPDLLTDLALTVDGVPTWGGVVLQAYEPITGTASGRYADGRVAAVDHVYGRGKTRLIGTMCGAGYGTHADASHARLYEELLAFAGVPQHVRVSDPRITARLHDGVGGTYLWVMNPVRQPVPVRITLGPAWGPFSTVRALWGAEATVDGRVVSTTAGARDVAVLALE